MIEYAGEAIRELSMDGRMTVCNMTIEGGARAGMVAPDENTFAYLEGGPFVPRGKEFHEAVERWKATRQRSWREIRCHRRTGCRSRSRRKSLGEPIPAWSPASPAACPDPARFTDPDEHKAAERALHYMALRAGTPIVDIPVDRVFIGSCTNSRIDDLRAAARVVAASTSATLKEALGRSRFARSSKPKPKKKVSTTFSRDAGFEWRDAGCSMCIGMNADVLPPSERSASTSNRNFEGRQGKGSRTHLVSPVMAAAAAIAGHFVDVRDFAVESVE